MDLPVDAPRAARDAPVDAPSSRRPVVAVVSDAIYPYHMGGKEVRYHHIVAGLAASGAEVHVYTMHWWKGPRHRIDHGVHYHALCRHWPLYTSSRRSILEAVMFALACLRLVGRRVDLIEADHMPHLPLFTIRLAAWLRRVPLVVTWHEYWGEQYWREYLGPLGTIAALVERLSVRMADVIVTPSPDTAASLVAHGVAADKIVVVPNGLDLDAIAAAQPAPHVDLLYVGRLLAHKHVDLLVEAVQTLRDAGSPLTCAIVGDGPERARVEAQVAEAGLSELVRFLGNVDEQSEIFALMKGAGVFVLPSTREGFGIVVAEAIACGVPVVTTAHPDNHARALVEHGRDGWLCDATTPSIVEAIRTARASTRGAASTTAASREDLGWQAATAQTLEVFARVSPAWR